MFSAFLTCEFLVGPAVVPAGRVAECVDDIAALRAVVNRGDHPVHIEDDAMGKLVNDGLYPADHIFAESLARAGVVAYSAKDVAKMINNIIMGSVCISDSTPDLLVDLCLERSAPEIENLSPVRSRDILSLLANIAARYQLTGFCGGVLHACEMSFLASVRVSAHLTCLVPDDGLLLPRQVSQDLQMYRSYSDLLDAQAPQSIFRSAAGEDEVKFAIFLMARAKLSERNLDASEFSVESFDVGDDFVPSLIRNQCAGGQRFGGVAFDVAADVVSGVSEREVSPFWNQENPSAARSRGNYEAFRTHVTKGNEGMRLMFWRNPGGRVILANVGPKNELRISRPDAGVEVR